LPAAGSGLRFAAITRRPELVPAGIEPIALPARIQELRMAVRVPLLLRRLRPALAHFLHSLPLALPCPAVLTVQDLSFERSSSLMGARERAIFRLVVPRSARRARRVIAISQRTKEDLVELYALPPERIVVTPLAADPAFRSPRRWRVEPRSSRPPIPPYARWAERQSPTPSRRNSPRRSPACWPSPSRGHAPGSSARARSRGTRPRGSPRTSTVTCSRE